MGDQCPHNGERNVGRGRVVCDLCGHTKCPECARFYEPVLGVKDARGVKRPVGLVSIQNEFPLATAIQREQLMTGTCSDKCWDKFMGIEDPSDTDYDPIKVE